MRRCALLVGGFALVVVLSMSHALADQSADVSIPESYSQEDLYSVPFVSADGRVVEAQVARRKGAESIPFWVEYEIQLEAAEAWYATAIAGDYISIQEQLRSSAGRIPGLLIDDFSDADMVSKLGTEWEYRAVDSMTGVWGVTSDSHGYMLPLSQCFGDDDTMMTDHAQLALGGLSTAGFDGIYLVLKGYGGHILDVRLDGVSSNTLPRMPGEWYDTWSGDPGVFYLPFHSFPQLSPSSLTLLELDLYYKNGCSGIFVYEVGLYTHAEELLKRSDPPGSLATRFEFSDNLTPRVVTIAFSDSDGVIYTYTEELAFRLHTRTRIQLGPSEASWAAATLDPSDETYRVEVSEDGRAQLVAVNI